MITLTLLHPAKTVPIQNWSFQDESVIRIGRSTDNDVVLYSAVVSRRHLEIRRSGKDWELVNIGANGTYINGKQVKQSAVENGMIIRLASSGPKIQIHIEPEESLVKKKLAQIEHSQSLNVPSEELEQHKETIINQ